MWLQGVDMLVGLVGSYDVRFREETKHMLGAEDLEGGCSFFTSFKWGNKILRSFSRGVSIFFKKKLKCTQFELK